jgi:hypothetical protein
MKLRLFAILFLWLSQSAEAASVLQTAADALAPGSWYQVPMSNVSITGQYPAWDDNVSDNPGLGSAVPGPAYDGYQPGWNSKKRRLYIQTTEHGRAGSPGFCPNGNSVAPGGPYGWPLYPHGCWKPTWIYDDATDTWNIGRTGQTITGPFPIRSDGSPFEGVHVWGHIAYDDTNEVLYVKEHWNGTAAVRFSRYCANAFPTHCVSQGANAWKEMTSYFPSGEGGFSAMVYHPGFMGTPGKLLYFGIYSGTCAQLSTFDETTGTWAVRDDGTSPACKFANNTYPLAWYSPAKRVSVFGGGGSASTDWWKIDDDGTITQLDDAPCAIGNTNLNFATGAADPVTGEIIIVGCGATPKLLSLNPLASPGSQWAVLDADLTGAGELCEISYGETCAIQVYATAISTYSVVGFWKYRTTPTAEYWIYKRANNDFASRCARLASLGAVRCVNFNATSDIANTEWGDNQALDITFVTTDPPTIDTAVKASGDGSLKFTQDSQSSAAEAGSYWTNFSSDLLTQYGAGQSFYIQWRQRFSSEFIDTIFTKIGGGNAGGWKQVIITTGDQPNPGGACNPGEDDCQTQKGVAAYSSCTAIDVPVQNTEQRKLPQMYNSCTGSTSHTAYANFSRHHPSRVISLDGSCSPDCTFQDARSAPYCTYSQQPGAGGSGLFPNNGNCFAYVANEWMTFTVKITIGQRGSGTTVGLAPNDEFVNSYIELWVGRDGQQSEQVLNFGPYPLSAGTSVGNQKFGKVYLTPYHTEKDPTQVHSPAYTWYDDLIISSVWPGDPALSGALPIGSGSPTAPTNLVVRQTSS